MKKKMNNKGFTLVELIVVLVILAILAAILVPALLGYIDRAKKQQYVLNAKSLLTATQAEFSSFYGQDKKPADGLAETGAKDRILKTADVDVDSFSVKVKGDSGHDAWTVSEAAYAYKDVVLVFNGTAWEEADTYTAKTLEIK